MKTKTLALITLSAALLFGAVAFAVDQGAESAEAALAVDCELLITPHHTTVVHGDATC